MSQFIARRGKKNITFRDKLKHFDTWVSLVSHFGSGSYLIGRVDDQVISQATLHLFCHQNAIKTCNCFLTKKYISGSCRFTWDCWEGKSFLRVRAFRFASHRPHRSKCLSSAPWKMHHFLRLETEVIPPCVGLNASAIPATRPRPISMKPAAWVGSAVFSVALSASAFSARGRFRHWKRNSAFKMICHIHADDGSWLATHHSPVFSL